VQAAWRDPLPERPGRIDLGFFPDSLRQLRVPWMTSHYIATGVGVKVPCNKVSRGLMLGFGLIKLTNPG
jgi:hypothetical protein